MLYVICDLFEKSARGVPLYIHLAMDYGTFFTLMFILSDVSVEEMKWVDILNIK